MQSDVEPGRIAELTLPVLEPLAPTPPVLAWEIHSGKEFLSPPQGSWAAMEPFKLTATDYGPKFLNSDTPPEMHAGKPISVNLTLENRGVETWTKAEYAVGCHWYSLDGLEVQWDGAKTPLAGDIPPGHQTAVKASVIPPAYDGQYYVVWDLAHGDRWASTTANTRGLDILVAPVKVIKGSLVAVDLTKSFDADVISFDTNRKDGDAGGGLTLPAEFLPPLVSETPPDGKLWTSGLWAALDGRDPSRRISFLYPSKLDGAKNAVTCNGQTINLKAGKYVWVHFLILATEKATAEFGFSYKDSKGSATAVFSPWSEPALPLAEQITDTAFVCPHRHSPDGDQPNQPCYLTHYAAPAFQMAEMTGITLPKNPALKIMAITLEKAP